MYQKLQQLLRFSVLTNFIDKAGLQRSQLLPLLIMGLFSLGLIFAVLHEKYKEPPAFSAIEQVRASVKINFDWFGGEVKPQKEIDLSNIPDNLPIANIDAQLLGVVLAGDASTATIKFGGSKEVVHFIGDKIEGKIKIVDIQGYRIIVLQDGVNKQMVMKKPDTIIEQSVGIAKSGKSSDSGFAFANMFGAVPVIAGGTTGFKLNDLSSEVQSLADIREGDVVIGVDGVSLKDIMADPSSWVKFSASTNLPVTVLRDGEKQIIYINASSLSAKIMPNLGFKP
jgi:type II secretory pathway component PulC